MGLIWLFGKYYLIVKSQSSEVLNEFCNAFINIFYLKTFRSLRLSNLALIFCIKSDFHLEFVHFSEGGGGGGGWGVGKLKI